MPTTEVLIDTLIHLRQDPRGLNLDQFCQILERFRADLVNQAFVILGNQEDAEDVAQETFSQAFTHLDQLREPAKISAWLRGINRNLAMNLRHRHFNAREERLTTGQASSVPAPKATTVSTSIVRAQDHVMSADPYWEGGMMAYRGTCANPNKGKGSIAVTAAAGLCRLMIGGARGDDPGVIGPCNIILKKWLPKQYPFNMYFGYYATLLMFQKGGDHWKAWNEAIKKVLPDAQCKGGNDDGSWDPTGSLADDGGRVMSTALCILCMEVYYRYAKLAPDAGN
jgi:hypothetical protein